ncbi:unnamed protein product, partial [Sphagnum tenellum]
PRPFLESYWESYLSFPNNQTNNYLCENITDSTDHSAYCHDLASFGLDGVDLDQEEGCGSVNLNCNDQSSQHLYVISELRKKLPDKIISYTFPSSLDFPFRDVAQYGHQFLDTISVYRATPVGFDYTGLDLVSGYRFSNVECAKWCSTIGSSCVQWVYTSWDEQCHVKSAAGIKVAANGSNALETYAGAGGCFYTAPVPWSNCATYGQQIVGNNPGNSTFGFPSPDKGDLQHRLPAQPQLLLLAVQDNLHRPHAQVRRPHLPRLQHGRAPLQHQRLRSYVLLRLLRRLQRQPRLPAVVLQPRPQQLQPLRHHGQQHLPEPGEH